MTDSIIAEEDSEKSLKDGSNGGTDSKTKNQFLLKKRKLDKRLHSLLKLS